MSANPPQRFGRYQVIEPLGSGAMGAVYLARDERLGREVAVKAIRDLERHGAGLAASLLRSRFENEARAVAALHHPHVVQVFDMGVEGETPFLVMEVAAGPSLRERLEGGALLDPAEAALLCAQIGSALDAAHARGILHRDIKPANLLQAAPGMWKLADFGVARVPGSSLTLAGQFLGTPAYAAPESIQLGEMTPATDVYGLGATVYAALTGEPPYGPRGLMTPGALAASEPPAPLSQVRADVPPQLAELVHRAVARDAAVRPSAAELARAASALVPVPAAVAPGAVTGHATAGIMTGHATAGIMTGHATAAVLAPAASGGAGLSRSQRRLFGLGAALGGVLLLGILIGASGGSDQASSPGRPGGVKSPSPASPAGERPPARPATMPPTWPGQGMGAHPSEGGEEARPGRGKHGKQHGKQRKRWNKAQEKLHKGEYREAAKHLRRILERDPDNQEALRLLEEIETYERQGHGAR